MGIHKPKSVEERKATLRLWGNTQKDEFNLDDFADAGFFFECSFDTHDDPGRLRCAFCPAVIGNWQPEDDPWIEHALSVDHCPHVIRRKGMEFVDRVKKEEEELAEISHDIDDFIAQDQMNFGLLSQQTSFGLFGLPMVATSREQKFSSSSSCEHNPGGMAHNKYIKHHCSVGGHHNSATQGVSDENMDSKETRLASFDRVRDVVDNDALLNQIAESGFYFEGMDSHGIKVRCYSCSCTLYDICEDEDLWTVHAQISECAHVMKLKGQDFIQNARRIDRCDKQERVSSSGGSAMNSWEKELVQGKEYDAESSDTQSPFQNTKHDTESSDTQRPFQNTKHDAESSDTQRPFQNKKHDAESSDTQRPFQNTKHDAESSDTQRPFQNKKHDADSSDNQRPFKNEKHDAHSAGKAGSAMKSCEQELVQGKENDAESSSTQRPFQNKEHDAFNTGKGLKRRQRVYSYQGRWYPIRWRPFLKCTFVRERHMNSREPGYIIGNMDMGGGTYIDDVVFLCCKLKVCSHSHGQGPCPRCFENKYV